MDASNATESPRRSVKRPESIGWSELDSGFLIKHKVLTYLDALTRHGRIFCSGNESIGAVVEVSLLSMLSTPML